MYSGVKNTESSPRVRIVASGFKLFGKYDFREEPTRVLHTPETSSHERYKYIFVEDEGINYSVFNRQTIKENFQEAILVMNIELARKIIHLLICLYLLKTYILDCIISKGGAVLFKGNVICTTDYFVRKNQSLRNISE